MKKAKLDILEQIPEIDLMQSEAQICIDAEDGADSPLPSSRAWAFNKLLMLGAPVALTLLVVCVTVFYFLFSGEIPEQPKTAPVVKIQSDAAKTTALQGAKEESRTIPGAREAALATPEKSVGKTAYINDFIIDLKDSGGNNRVLLCDIAFELGPDQKRESFENDVNVRNIIYKTARSRSSVALKSVEERKKLKQDLASELDRTLGNGSVKTVYFINYFIM